MSTIFRRRKSSVPHCPHHMLKDPLILCPCTPPMYRTAVTFTWTCHCYQAWPLPCPTVMPCLPTPILIQLSSMQRLLKTLSPWFCFFFLPPYVICFSLPPQNNSSCGFWFHSHCRWHPTRWGLTPNAPFSSSQNVTTPCAQTQIILFHPFQIPRHIIWDLGSLLNVSWTNRII